MSDQKRTMPQRAADAYATLRGRPPKPDYGLLVIMPFLAAAAGSLIGLVVESALGRAPGAARRSAAEKPV